MENFSDIKGYVGYYKIGDLGTVISIDKITWNGKSKCARKQKVMKSRIDNNGYVTISLSKKGIKKKHLLHRLIAEAFIYNPESKPTVNHKDGIKTNNYKSNLEWTTRSEQNIHASKLGLKKFCGEHHSQHKLTEAEVKNIRNRASLNEQVRGGEYGVSDVTIRDIINKKSWKHI